eukprot:TRINITY_DN6832_c0_g2_i1.p1 TRINITY_DN6832_c0_g2~~TRINITY_DN6832_c0_g2_i1.p1  ORF type:complete len:633 (+),score=109.43 TRINITY_DN6832_c0_g2_i1:55-1899(+)
MEGTWNWENFSLEGFDAEVKDLSATSTSFRILLANLASQHILELEEVRRVAAVDRQATKEELQRLATERESLQEQLESLDTLQSRTRLLANETPLVPQEQLENPARSRARLLASETLPPPCAIPQPKVPPEEVQNPPNAAVPGGHGNFDPEHADQQVLVVAHKDLTTEQKTKLLLQAESRLRGEETAEAAEAAEYAAYGLVIDNSFLGRLTKLVLRVEWEMTFAVMILVNVLVMGFQLQFEGLDTGYLVSFPQTTSPADEVWPGGRVIFKISEFLFGTIFAIDIYLRIGLLGRYFWRSYFNWFDAVVVTAGILELVWMDLIINTTVLRLLRIVKMGRSVRLMRISASLDSLRSILRCISASFHTLFWSLFLLFIIQCIFAMSIMYAVEDWMHDSNNDDSDRRTVFKYYGTFTRSMLTMFEILFANWAPSCRVLVEQVTEWFALAFILYRCLVGFAVLNVVNAVFVQSTMKVAQQDAEYIITQKQKSAEQIAGRLRRLFEQLDSSGDGSLSWDEFSVLITDPRMAAMVASIEVEAHDLEVLFKILDDGDGNIQMEEFTQGILRVRGMAKALDVAQLLSISKRLERKVESIHKATLPENINIAGVDAHRKNQTREA